MYSRLLPLSLSLMLALGAPAGVYAQSKARTPAQGDKAAVLPVLNNASGKVEAYLLLEPTATPVAGARWRFGQSSLGAAFGLDSGDTLGLVCDRKNGLTNAIGNLANHCMMAALDQDHNGRGSRQGAVGASLSRAAGRIGVALGSGRDTLPAWLSPSSRQSKFEQNTLTVYGQKHLGAEATVSIGGTWARATLIPAGQASTELADQWTTRSLTVGATRGAFSANVIGRVVETPSQPGQWEGLGVGLTWRTPWSGQLTVGAENVVTRGRNPFAPGDKGEGEGTVPYVRYEQDL